jgi:hypothetical protein
VPGQQYELPLPLPTACAHGQQSLLPAVSLDEVRHHCVPAAGSFGQQ